jgi:hypothetical protein
MKKDTFNQMVGLIGNGHYSSFTAADFQAMLSGSSGGSLFPTTTPTSGTIFSSTSSADISAQQIAKLQEERTNVSTSLLSAQTRLAQLQQERGKCKTWTGLWDNNCLDRNTAMQNEQNAVIRACQERLVAIDAEITKIQAEAAAIRQAEQEAAQKAAANSIAVIKAQAMANPETAAILKNAEIAMAKAKENSKVLIAAGIAALLIIVGTLFFIFKK